MSGFPCASMSRSASTAEVPGFSGASAALRRQARRRGEGLRQWASTSHPPSVARDRWAELGWRSSRRQGGLMSTDIPEVTDNTAEHQFEIRLDGQTAFAEYRLAKGVIILPHTVVP